MLVSETWLREWVAPKLSTDELADRLTLAGLEVGGIERLGGLDKRIVVARIVDIAPHPDADRLNVCQVDVGRKRALTIVCGAANARRGLYTIAALVGATLPGDFRIEKRAVRGVSSHGMLCSAAELGLEDESDGIIELDGRPTTGVTATEHLKLDDAIIDIELTPNRGDCLSMRGVAREVSALTSARLKSPVRISPVTAGHDEVLPVTLEATAACPRYLGRVLKGVDVRARTPLWMKERLRRAGIRSLGPCVDVTNYVMIELGQPMHAFDLDRLDTGIVVRHANGREKLELLDGTVVRPRRTDLLIADHSGPLALAGVMGGAASAVTDDTTDILLESAFFTPEVIAVTTRDRGIHSDSSHRFERGVDFQQQREALERATALLMRRAGGTPGPVIEALAEADLPRRVPVSLRSSHLERLLGIRLPAAKIRSSLERLGMKVTGSEGSFRVTPPSWRFDIGLEADLIEEAARLTGFEQIPGTPPMAQLQIAAGNEEVLPVRRLEQLLVDRGFNEVVTYSFIDRETHELMNPDDEPLELLNPISADMSVMRASLWPGLVKAAQTNFNRQTRDLRLFESGLVFRKQGRRIMQRTHLGGLVSGQDIGRYWDGKPREVDYFDLKGHVEALIHATGRADDFGFEAQGVAALHPGQSARILDHGGAVGLIGRLHPALEQRLGMDQPVFLFEIELDSLVRAAVPAFRPMSRYPAIQRDIALVLDKDVPASRVFEAIVSSGGDLLVNLELFDQYQGEHIDFGKKSLAYTLTLQHSSRTLRDQEVEDVMQRVLASLDRDLGAQLR